jgi:MFS family permease
MESGKFGTALTHEEFLSKYNINPNRAMFTLILSIIVDTFGYSMVFPLLPGIAKGFGASDIMLGLFISSNAVMILIFGPIWGKLSDKYGRKSVLMFTQVGTGIAFLILASANTIEVFLLARIVDVIFSAQFVIVSAYVSDITTPQMRASKSGKIMVGYTSGMTIGPLIGGVLGVINWRFPALFASGD